MTTDLIKKLEALTATASRLPYRDGDGYSWGGEAILTIGDKSILIGAGVEAFEIAKEIAHRWNTSPLAGEKRGAE